MKTLLDLENYARREHFEFFSRFEEPFFGVTVDIDCTAAYKSSQDRQASFFLYYLHKTLLAVNALETFRYRIENGGIAVHDVIHASATISRQDGSFGFSLIAFHKDFNVFAANALIEIERVKQTPGLFTRSFDEDNLIHFSALPWVKFTAISHARSYTFPDSCPKISFGKMTVSSNGGRTMPMSVHVHHGLMDGLHVGQFIDHLQQLMKE